VKYIASRLSPITAISGNLEIVSFQHSPVVFHKDSTPYQSDFTFPPQIAIIGVAITATAVLTTLTTVITTLFTTDQTAAKKPVFFFFFYSCISYN
jgi:hypothetical protein